MIFIGIDPGLHGAVGIIDGNQVVVQDTPSTTFDGKGKYLPQAMAAQLARFKDMPQSVLAILEDVHSMPKQGVASSFNFGVGKGLWLGILAAYNIPTQLVSPQRWKKTMELNSDKNTARALAAKLFPSIADQLKLVKHDGRAEALLMAEYGKLTR